MGSSFAKVLREAGLGAGRPSQASFSLSCPPCISSRLRHLAVGAASQGGASERGGAPPGGGQPAMCVFLKAFRAGEEGTAGTLGGHNTCALSHASQVMGTKVLLGWPPQAAPSLLPSPLGPWLAKAMLEEGCSPRADFDLIVPRAHGQFCCPCLPTAHACPCSLRRTTTESRFSPCHIALVPQSGFSV